MAKRKVISKQKRREKRLNQCPNPHFSIGDLVQVKDGVMDLNWPDLPLGGWVGRIDKTRRTVNGPKYDVTWTPETLADAHPIYQMLSDDELLNPAKYDDLLETDLILHQEGTPILLADPGDVTHYTDRPLSPDDFFDRLRMVFGLKALEEIPWPDANGAYERYLDYLSRHLTLPFEAEFFGEKKHGTAFTCKQLFLPESVGYDDDVNGIHCRGIDHEGNEIICSLFNISVKDGPHQELIEDYQDWC